MSLSLLFLRFWETPKYNSQELDKETGYYFYNARHYDAGIGRFVTPDNVIPYEDSTQSWNRYSYCRNNPIIYKDPTGHFDVSTLEDFAGKIGNALGYDVPDSPVAHTDSFDSDSTVRRAMRSVSYASLADSAIELVQDSNLNNFLDFSLEGETSFLVPKMGEEISSNALKLSSIPAKAAGSIAGAAISEVAHRLTTDDKDILSDNVTFKMYEDIWKGSSVKNNMLYSNDSNLSTKDFRTRLKMLETGIVKPAINDEKAGKLSDNKYFKALSNEDQDIIMDYLNKKASSDKSTATNK